MAERRTTKTANQAAKKATAPADQADVEVTVLAKSSAMPVPYRAMSERLHALILRSAPALQPTLWYGMPASAKDGEVICFFRTEKYMTFGLSN
jgi:hypothetical protein